MIDQSTTSRLRALRIDVDPDVAERQTVAMLSELRAAPLVSSPVPVRTPRRARRRLVATLAATFALLVPVAAFAAEDTVPGDFLYPVKQSTEWARSLVDRGVAQQHRVQELEIVVDRGAPIAVITERFDASVAVVDEQESELMRRVEEARERVRERYGVDLVPMVSGARDRDSSTGDPDPGNRGTPGSGSESRFGDGATDPSESTTTTSVADHQTDRSGSGSDGDAGTDGTTPTTAGQPEDAPTPRSGGDRP
jgi:hypothetical protein